MHSHGTVRTGQRAGVSPRPVALLDILVAFAPIAVLGVIGTGLGTDTLAGGMIVNLGYVLAIMIAWGLLRLRGTGWLEIGLSRPKSWASTVLLSLAALAGALFVIVAVQVIALNLPGADVAPIDQSRFDPMMGNVSVLIVGLVLAWTTVAFGEEMFYRAFMITRLADFFQETNAGWAIAVVGSGVVFGLVHYVEGPLGIISNGTFGILFGWIYLRTGRNLWVTIIAHGLLNTLRFVLLFLGAA